MQWGHAQKPQVVQPGSAVPIRAKQILKALTKPGYQCLVRDDVTVRHAETPDIHPVEQANLRVRHEHRDEFGMIFAHQVHGADILAWPHITCHPVAPMTMKAMVSESVIVAGLVDK